MKLVVDFFDLQKLPQYLKKSSNQRQISLYIRCPFDVAFVCDDVYDDVTKLTKNYNADISLVFVVENYNIDINTLTKLKTFSKKKGINVFLEDKYEISENYYEEDYISLEQAIEAIKKLDNIVKVVKSHNLSPFETLLLSYLFVTKRVYKEESLKMSQAVSRSIFYTLNNKYIVCTGYCNIIKAIVDKYNSPDLQVFNNTTKYDSWNDSDFHATLISYVKDKKYGIDTYSYLDPTNDSERTSKIDRDYRLRSFMLPISDLKHILDRPYKIGSNVEFFDKNDFAKIEKLDKVCKNENLNSFAYDGLNFSSDLRKALNDNINVINYYSKKYQALKQKYSSMIEQIDEKPQFLAEDFCKFSKPISLAKLKIALTKVLPCFEKEDEVTSLADKIIDDNVKYINQQYDEKATNAFSKKCNKDYFEK